jgi:uncharacterized DUF497 family protein
MIGPIAGFNWDAGNREKCQKHGVPVTEIEALFDRPLMMRPDLAHSANETRFQAVGKNPEGRSIFLVFTIRTISGERYIRPISARYMHRREVKAYEEENPGLSD